jgi:hypothetical protein
LGLAVVGLLQRRKGNEKGVLGRTKTDYFKAIKKE